MMLCINKQRSHISAASSRDLAQLVSTALKNKLLAIHCADRAVVIGTITTAASFPARIRDTDRREASHPEFQQESDIQKTSLPDQSTAHWWFPPSNGWGIVLNGGANIINQRHVNSGATVWMCGELDTPWCTPQGALLIPLNACLKSNQSMLKKACEWLGRQTSACGVSWAGVSLAAHMRSLCKQKVIRGSDKLLPGNRGSDEKGHHRCASNKTAFHWDLS